MALNLPKGMHEHYGRNTERMPELLRAGEVPMFAARFMQARLQKGNDFPHLWTNYADTSDLVVYPQGNDKDVYILLTVDKQGKNISNGRRALELIRAYNLASNHGAIVEELEDISGNGLIKVPRKRIITETDLTQRQILKQLVWRILARHPDEVPAEFAEDKNLLRDYSKEIQSRTGSQRNMALYLGEALDDKTTLKAWCVGRLGNRSDASGRLGLDSDFGRLVGFLAPEALGKGVEKVKTYTEVDLQKFDVTLKGLEDALHPDVIRQFADLRRKL